VEWYEMHSVTVLPQEVQISLTDHNVLSQMLYRFSVIDLIYKRSCDNLSNNNRI